MNRHPRLAPLVALVGLALAGVAPGQALFRGSAHDPRSGVTTHFQKNADGSTVFTRTDARGRVLSQKIEKPTAGRPAALHVDGRGTTTRVHVEPDGTKTTTVTDADGRLVLRTDRPDDTVAYGEAFDPETGRATRADIKTDGSIVVTRFDPDGSFAEQERIGPDRPPLAEAVDATGEVIRWVWRFDGVLEVTRFDAAGRLLYRTERDRGRVTTWIVPLGDGSIRVGRSDATGKVDLLFDIPGPGRGNFSMRSEDRPDGGENLDRVDEQDRPVDRRVRQPGQSTLDAYRVRLHRNADGSYIVIQETGDGRLDVRVTGGDRTPPPAPPDSWRVVRRTDHGDGTATIVEVDATGRLRTRRVAVGDPACDGR